jgi:hypothetical protein
MSKEDEEIQLPLILFIYHQRWHNRGLINGLRSGLQKRKRRGTLPFDIEYLSVFGEIYQGNDPELDEQVSEHFLSRIEPALQEYDLVLTPGHFILSPAIKKHYSDRIIGCTANQETITHDTFNEGSKIYFAEYKGNTTHTAKDYFISDVMRLLKGE